MASLAQSLEQVRMVRKRFRIGAPWIHIPKNDGGDECLQCVRGLKANYSIILTMLDHFKQAKVLIDPLQAEAPRSAIKTTETASASFPLNLRIMLAELMAATWVRRLFRDVGYMPEPVQKRGLS